MHRRVGGGDRTGLLQPPPGGCKRPVAKSDGRQDAPGFYRRRVAAQNRLRQCLRLAGPSGYVQLDGTLDFDVDGGGPG